LLAKGEHKISYLKHRGHVPLVFKIGDEPVSIRRDEIKKYVEDPYFLNILSYYNMTKLWGMPNGNGWANEPVDMLEGITALEMEAKAIEAEMYETTSNKPKTTTDPKALGAKQR